MEDNRQDSQKEKIENIEKMEKNRIIVSVRGMSCVTCASAIERRVKKLKGVDDVNAAIMLDKVFIDYNPKLIDSTTIRKEIDKTGYRSYMIVEEKYEDRS